MAGVLDWLDVLIDPRGGPAVIRAAFAAGVVVRAEEGGDAEGGGGGGEGGGGTPLGPQRSALAPDERLLLPANPVERARLYIERNWISADGRHLTLIEVEGLYYRFEHDRWVPFGRPEELAAQIARWGLTLDRIKWVKGDGGMVEQRVPANLSDRDKSSILENVGGEVMVSIPRRDQAAGRTVDRFWMASTERAAQRVAMGLPIHAAPPWKRVLEDVAAESLPRAESLLALPDGLLDVDAWDRGQWRLLPHTPRLFNANVFRLGLPIHELEDLCGRAERHAQKELAVKISAGRATAWDLARVRAEYLCVHLPRLVERMAPRFCQFLREALGAPIDPGGGGAESRSSALDPQHSASRAPAPAPPSEEDGGSEGVTGAALAPVDPDDWEEARAQDGAEISRAALGYEDNERELSKAGGYYLTPDVSRQEGNMLILHGYRGTGKSTMLSVFLGIMGAAAIALTVEQLTKPEYQYECLGKLLAVMSDERVTDATIGHQASNVLKMITGGDPISCRTLFGKPVTGVRLSTRILMAVNEMPALQDPALLRRMIVIDFSRVPRHVDRGLVETLAEPGERVGQLLWMLLGRLRLALDDGFEQPASSRGPLDAYEDDVSVYAQFVAACLEITGDERHQVRAAEVAEVFDAYARAEHRWAKTPGPGKLMRSIVSELNRLGPGKVRRTQVREGEARPRVYVGLRLIRQASDYRRGDVIPGARLPIDD